MDKKKAIIILFASISLAAIGFYFYRKNKAFTPTSDSINYDIVIELKD